MSATAYSITIDGYPATEIAPHSPPTWETLADGGCGEATWEFAITPSTRHHALRPSRSLAVIKCGTHPVFTGLLTEVDRETGQCHAFGLSSSLHGILALDEFNAPTRNVGTAITQAIARGWKGSNPAPVTGTAAGDATGNPVTVGKLLDDYASQTGQRWGVDERGRVYMNPGPSTHQWLASPGTGAFGVTGEDLPSRIAGQYETGAGKAMALVGTDGAEETVDLTDRGAMTLTAAEAVLNGMLARRGDVVWTNGVTLSSGQLANLGGVPAFLPAVRAGAAMKTLGIGHMLPSGPLRHVVIGKTSYTAGAASIYVEPVSTAPRGQVDVIAA